MFTGNPDDEYYTKRTVGGLPAKVYRGDFSDQSDNRVAQILAAWGRSLGEDDGNLAVVGFPWRCSVTGGQGPV